MTDLFAVDIHLFPLLFFSLVPGSKLLSLCAQFPCSPEVLKPLYTIGMSYMRKLQWQSLSAIFHELI